jgi:predicted dithiol-disulfide oxidoreductase (DUF899 family)
MAGGAQGASQEREGADTHARSRRRRTTHSALGEGRGNEEVIGAFIYLDITPKGRNEKEIMDWVRRHDEY